MIDLRSDTVTQPTRAMRQAMADAEVGDDVYGEDPTVRALEELAAARLERAAALFVPTGTMGNQIAVHLQTTPGSEVIIEARGHIVTYEMGAMAALSGALPRPLVTTDGVLHPEQVAAAVHPPLSYLTPSRLLCLENTHNLWSGRPIGSAHTRALCAAARAHGLRIHLDGARLFNAAAALGESAAALARGCDTVMFCLSKGLAAPAGSLLVGEPELIAEARRVRKMLGGGMRQVGVLAAAGLVALRDMTERLAEDHHRAQRLATALADVVDLDPTRILTNIVVFPLRDDAVAGDPGMPVASRFVAAMATRGVRCGAMSPHEVRLVTHCDVDDAAIDTALTAAREVLGRPN